MLAAEDCHETHCQPSEHDNLSMDVSTNTEDETKQHETKPLTRAPSCTELMQVMLSEEKKVVDEATTNTDVGNEYSKMLKESVEQYQNDNKATKDSGGSENEKKASVNQQITDNENANAESGGKSEILQTDQDPQAQTPSNQTPIKSDELFKAMSELEKPRRESMDSAAEKKESAASIGETDTVTADDGGTSAETKDLKSEDTATDEKVSPVQKTTEAESSKSKSTSKYTCIGSAQQISCKVATKSSEKTKVLKPTKRTEKYVIKNVSKVSKIYKVSNLNYKIKPLRRGGNHKYPLIYIGEPSFVDLEDFWPEGAEETPAKETPEVKEVDLYDLERLKNVFTHTDNAAQAVQKPLLKYPYPDIPHPTLNNLKRYMTIPPVNFQKVLLPKNQFTYTAPVSINQSMIRIVARTVPSATLASASYTSTTAKTKQPIKITYPPKIDVSVKQTKVPVVISGGFASIPSKDRKALSLPTLTSTARNMAMVVKSHTSSPVMTVKLVGANQTQATSVSAKPISTLPVKIIQPKKVTKIKTVLALDKKSKPVVVFPKSTSRIKVVKAQSLKSPPPSTKTVSVNVPLPTHVPVKSEISGKAKPDQIIKATEAKSTPLTTSASIGTPILKPITVSKSAIKVVPPKIVSPTSKISTQKSTPVSKRLREGVEVAFQDGVQHFVSNLKHLTYLDDEPIKHWSDVKKGMEVAAMYTDGLVYDATIVACYFERKMQPVVELEKLESDDPYIPLKSEKSNSSTGKIPPTNGERSYPIGCTKCRQVFRTIRHFRNHQRYQCQSPGIRVPEGTKITDAMLENMKDTDVLNYDQREKLGPKKGKRKSHGHSKSESVKTEMKKLNDAMLKALEKTDETLNTESKRKKRKHESITTSEPLEKCPKMDQTTDTADVPSPTNDDVEVFEPGTRFLHRWQLDDGSSRWYNGEVLSIVSPSTGLKKDREFKVSYAGEDEDYVIKLYEDYPADIRIMGGKML